MNETTLRELAEQKEKEWRCIQEKRIEALEASLRQKSQELADQKLKMAQLRDDFKYNLKLLEDRDVELGKYEETLLATRKQLAEKNAEISDLKIKIDDLKKIIDNDQNAVDECKKFYMNRLNQKNVELEKYKASKDVEINKERSEIEKLKRTLHLQLQDVQLELERQRSELKTEFDEIVRKREHEWRMQGDEMASTILARDLEIKMLKGELASAKNDLEALRANVNDEDEVRKSLERRLKEKDWELKDVVALKDVKIKDLESKLNSLDTNQKVSIDALNRKNEELDRQLHEKQMIIENLKTTLSAHEATKNSYDEQIAELRHLIEQERHRNQQTTKSTAPLSDELDRLRGEYAKAMAKNEQTDAVRRALAASKERVAKLENELVHVNFDWQDRYRELEKVKIADSDAFNKKLLDEKNQALDRIRVLEDQLRHKENVIQALQTNEPLLEGVVESSEFKLREENEKLKAIVKQMREEIESLASSNNAAISGLDLFPQPLVESTATAASAKNREQRDQQQSQSHLDYEADLKQQLLEAKQKMRQLQTQIDKFVLKQKLPPEALTDNAIINSHLKTMNETVDILRKEKVDLMALAKKQQAKLIGMEKQLSEQIDENRQKQAHMETLKYEMSSQTRRMGHEVENLKRTVASLELELNATRREADEYHKATIEKASDVSALETKISELKLKLSTSGNQVNFGAQELFIQQLQDEIKRLSSLNQQLQIRSRQQICAYQRRDQPAQRQKQRQEHDIDEHREQSSQNEQTLDILRMKLKTAAKYISYLMQEKEHLIEMSNQLRGELNRIKYNNDNMTLMRLNRDVQEATQDVNRQLGNATMKLPLSNTAISPRTALTNQLQQLEKKQYELTKQQLAFAQVKNRTKSAPNLAPNNKQQQQQQQAKTTAMGAAVIESSSSDTNTMNSSVRSENLRELWKILDNNDHLEAELSSPQQQQQQQIDLQVTGIKPPSVAWSKATSSKSPKTPRSINNTSNAKKNTNRIRNYNIKD